MSSAISSLPTCYHVLQPTVYGHRVVASGDGKKWREGRRSHNGTQFSQSIRLVRPIYLIYIYVYAYMRMCRGCVEGWRSDGILYSDGKEGGGLDNDDLT